MFQLYIHCVVLSVYGDVATCNILYKFMHAFLSNLANRQTDKHGQTHLPLSEVIMIAYISKESLKY